jgi:hypothetical protein
MQDLQRIAKQRVLLHGKPKYKDNLLQGDAHQAKHCSLHRKIQYQSVPYSDRADSNVDGTVLKCTYILLAAHSHVIKTIVNL